MKIWASVALAGLLATAPALAGESLLDRDYRQLAGKQTVNLQSTYGGQVLLVVNTASKCGFTPQYEGLEAMHAKYKGQGFAVLGFPSNDFMGQEPGTEAEIKSFCTLTYGVTFPMFAKISVKGKTIHPLYAFLTDEKLHPGSGGAISWNFNKFLIGRDGRVIRRYAPQDKPESLARDIEVAFAA